MDIYIKISSPVGDVPQEKWNTLTIELREAIYKVLGGEVQVNIFGRQE